jgi:hypothetical protein
MTGCGIELTDIPFLLNSKELDHIIPLNIGGTHTIGNVRIICRKCNSSRPKDGSDYFGQLSLWCDNQEVASSLRSGKKKKRSVAVPKVASIRTAAKPPKPVSAREFYKSHKSVRAQKIDRLAQKVREETARRAAAYKESAA